MHKVNISFVNYRKIQPILGTPEGQKLFDQICSDLSGCPTGGAMVGKEYAFARPYGKKFVGVRHKIVYRKQNELRPYRHEIRLIANIKEFLGDRIWAADQTLQGQAQQNFRALLCTTAGQWPSCTLERQGIEYLVANARQLAEMIDANQLGISDALLQFRTLRDTVGIPCNSNLTAGQSESIFQRSS